MFDKTRRYLSLPDVGGVVGGESNAKRRTDGEREIPLPRQLAAAIRSYCVSNKRTTLGWWGGGADAAGGGGGLTNCITGHYRCSVIDYLYPYKMPGSLVDRACLASSDQMFPLNHHTRANNTFKYIRDLSDSPVCTIDVKIGLSRTGSTLLWSLKPITTSY